MNKLVLATGNAGKVVEMQRLLEAQQIEVFAQSAFAVPGVEETGLSFIENALIKARHAAQYSELPALADDSGLCVDALNGAPGIYSARYSGADANDERNNLKLLEKLKGVSGKKRSAHFHCVLVLVRDPQDPAPVVCEGIWHGVIADGLRGSEGFGYDPLFIPDGLDLSSAELEPATKNRISHRGLAMQKLLQALRA